MNRTHGIASSYSYCRAGECRECTCNTDPGFNVNNCPVCFHKHRACDNCREAHRIKMNRQQKRRQAEKRKGKRKRGKPVTTGQPSGPERPAAARPARKPGPVPGSSQRPAQGRTAPVPGQRDRQRATITRIAPGQALRTPVPGRAASPQPGEPASPVFPKYYKIPFNCDICRTKWGQVCTIGKVYAECPGCGNSSRENVTPSIIRALNLSPLRGAQLQAALIGIEG